jgi:hypothetical protein
MEWGWRVPFIFSAQGTQRDFDLFFCRRHFGEDRGLMQRNANIKTDDHQEWGWRVPFIFSAVLVIIGLYVRVSLHETPVFAKVVDGHDVEQGIGCQHDEGAQHRHANVFGQQGTQRSAVDADDGSDWLWRDGADRRPAGGCLWSS